MSEGDRLARLDKLVSIRRDFFDGPMNKCRWPTPIELLFSSFS